jgi:hypothetical protein
MATIKAFDTGNYQSEDDAIKNGAVYNLTDYIHEESSVILDHLIAIESTVKAFADKELEYVIDDSEYFNCSGSYLAVFETIEEIAQSTGM